MRNTIQRKGNTRETLKRSNGVVGCNDVQKYRKKNSGQCHKATDLLVGKDDSALPSSMDETICAQLPVIGTSLPQTGQTLDPSAKIKLQLFPIDDRTRIRLEKDGYHPYLELTVRARKKITSVLEHLNSKWGRSSISLGEPILFPYNVHNSVYSSRGWTLNETDICVGDVYAAVRFPAVFRLRYGWFTNTEIKTLGVPSTSTCYESCVQPQGVTIHSGVNMKRIYGERKQTAVTNAVTTANVTSDIPSEGLVDQVDNEVRMDTRLGQPSVLWADGMTNVSVGGLLSEASLQGMINTCDPKLNGNYAGLQPSQLISDSFDAFIAALRNCSQGARKSSQDFPSSILDAEDTCHAFPFQNFASSGNVNIQAQQSQDRACQPSETDLLLCSRVYDDESSLGLTGIKWSDSSAPFDFGLSSSRKNIVGKSSSIRGISSQQYDNGASRAGD